MAEFWECHWLMASFYWKDRLATSLYWYRSTGTGRSSKLSGFEPQSCVQIGSALAKQRLSGWAKEWDGTGGGAGVGHPHNWRADTRTAAAEETWLTDHWNVRNQGTCFDHCNLLLFLRFRVKLAPRGHRRGQAGVGEEVIGWVTCESQSYPGEKLSENGIKVICFVGGGKRAVLFLTIVQNNGVTITPHFYNVTIFKHHKFLFVWH